MACDFIVYNIGKNLRRFYFSWKKQSSTPGRPYQIRRPTKSRKNFVHSMLGTTAMQSCQSIPTTDSPARTRIAPLSENLWIPAKAKAGMSSSFPTVPASSANRAVSSDTWKFCVVRAKIWFLSEMVSFLPCLCLAWIFEEVVRNV